MALSEEDKAYFQEQLREARRIIREDKVLAKLNKQFPDEPVTDPVDPVDPDKPKPPPRKDKPDDPPKKRDRWWGDALDE